MSTSLDNLPEINFVQKDPETILKELISDFEERAGRKLYPADPLRIILQGIAYNVALQNNKIDYSAKQNLLRYAGDGFLQNIAALLGVTQAQPKTAKTTLRFTISAPQGIVVTIPEGTRVTAGNKVYFATTELVEIPIGATSVEVSAECTEPGEVGNGFYSGQINILSDPFPYWESVENVTDTEGGADLESLESLRERTRIAPESFSTAGPDGAYEYWAKTASQLIVDVAVDSPEPGVVEIIPLLKNGEIPGQEILDAIYDECSDKTRRPLTDKVIVTAPEVINYDLKLKYYISRSNISKASSIQLNVLQAISEFELWQKSGLGRDINPSKLTEMIMTAGAKRVEVQEPMFSVLETSQIAIMDQQEITYGGLEDD